MLLSSAAAFSDCKQRSNPFLKEGMRYFSAPKDGLPFTYTTFSISRASSPTFRACDKLSGLLCLSLGSYIQPLDSDNTWSLPSLETLTCLSLTSHGTPQLLQPSVLTNCYLTFDYVLPTGNLAAFLSSCPSLDRLTLSLKGVF